MDATDQVKKAIADPNVQASSLLAAGPVLWKWVSAASNLDFLLSLTGERFNLFLNFLEGPGWIILTTTGVVWLAIVLLRRRRSEYVAPQSPTWWLLGSCSIVSLLFGIFVAISASGTVPNIISGWGSPGPGFCSANIDMTRLLTFRSKYKLAIVCGVTNNNIDKLDDQTITVSNLFTITPGAVAIVTPFRSGTQSLIDKMQEEFATAMKKDKSEINVQVQMWYDPILIPIGIPVDKITKLSDVLALGGKILRPQYYN